MDYLAIDFELVKDKESFSWKTTDIRYIFNLGN